MIFSDPIGLTVSICALVIVVLAFFWFMLEKFFFKEKTSLRDSIKSFREKKPNIADHEQKFQMHRHSRPSIAFLNGNFNSSPVNNQQFETKGNISRIEERIQTLEGSIDEVKEILRKVSNVEIKRKKTIEFSGPLPSWWLTDGNCKRSS